jgi:peptide chain release factor 1
MMFQKLESVENHYNALAQRLSDPKILENREEYRKLSQEYAELTTLIETYQEYKKTDQEIEENQNLLQDEDKEIQELAKLEVYALKEKRQALESSLKTLLLPKDPLDKKNIILEIRAGTGGEEAALFASVLFRMYCRFAESRGWRVEIMSSNPTGLGGFKEVIALIEGQKVYSHLNMKAESTESSGSRPLNHKDAFIPRQLP